MLLSSFILSSNCLTSKISCKKKIKSLLLNNPSVSGKAITPSKVILKENILDFKGSVHKQKNITLLLKDFIIFFDLIWKIVRFWANNA
jgi:hypothetical protein